MKLGSIIILVVMVLLAAAAAVILRKRKTIAVLTVLLSVIPIGIMSLYCFNTSFRDNVDIWLSPDESHRYTIDNDTYYLPLPPKTKLAYRTSDVSAVYKTKCAADEISAVYRNVADEGTFEELGDESILSFRYNGEVFNISVDEADNFRRVIIHCKNYEGGNN